MYKKLLLAFVSIISINTVKAQTEKGSQMLGVSFGVSTNSSDYKPLNNDGITYGDNIHAKQTSYNFAPEYSYFIADKLDLGVSVGYGQSKVENSNTSAISSYQKTHNFTSAIYLRKYILYDNKIGIRTGPFLSYTNSKQTFLYDDATQSYYNNTSDSYGGGISLDFVYFPIKKLGLAARMGNINYYHQVVGGYSKGTSNGFNLNFVNALALSVNYVFGN